MGRSSTTSASNNIRQLRQLLSNAEITSRDPWHLPPAFFLTRDDGCWFRLEETVSGSWKYNNDECIAIRSGDGEESFSSATNPRYVGVRRTLEFYLKDGTRTDWAIYEYSHVYDRRPCHNKRRKPSLFLEDEVVICKVFKKGAIHETSSPFQLPGLTILKISGESSNAYDLRTIHLCKQLQDEIDSLLEYAELDPIVHRGTRAKSDDDVWQHFTKIRTKDPGVVYAVCHHCDKALKSHCSQKHCVSQLERHRKSDKCRSSCSNPSTDEDREMLHRLRAALDELREQQRMEGKLQCQEFNAHLAQLNPWFLGHNHPSWYATTSLNRKTNEGCWEEIDKEFTAIRMEQQQMQGFWMAIGKEITTAIQNDYQMQMQVPQYMGLRRTLEFHLNQNGHKLKTGWIMLEYQQIDNIESPALFLQGDMVIRKVFHYDKDAVTAIFSEFDRRLNDDNDNDNEEHYNGEGVNMVTALSTDYKHGGGDRKRKRTAVPKRTSEVWLYFTEIRTTDHNVVYAVCHHCDRGYSSGRSTNGTSHLWRHKRSCTNKPTGRGNANNGTSAGNQKSGHSSYSSRTMEKQSIRHQGQGCAEARRQEDGAAC